jgi:hypothetical protein
MSVPPRLHGGAPPPPRRGSPSTTALSLALAQTPPEIVARRAILATLAGTVGVPPTWGRATFHVFATRAALRLAALVCMIVALAAPWWRAEVGGPGVWAGGTVWSTTACTARAQCSSRAAWFDAGSTLGTGQLVAIVGLLGSVVLAWVQRLAARLPPASAAAARAGLPVARLRLLAGEEAWAAAGASSGSAQQPAPNKPAPWQLRRLTSLAAVDAATLLLTLVGTAVFLGQIHAWYAASVAATPGGVAATSVTLTAGAHAAVTAVVLSGCVAAFSAATLTVEWRAAGGGAAGAAAGASPPQPLSPVAASSESAVEQA